MPCQHVGSHKTKNNYLIWNTFSVGAHEQREAAMAVCLIHRYRGLAMLGRSYTLIAASERKENLLNSPLN
jgi:hypothetical protein